MQKFFVAAVAGLAVLGWSLASRSVAEAGKGKKKKGDVEAQFKKLDTNSDGKLTKEEFAKVSELGKKNQAGKPKKIDALFSRLDTNSDGFLSLEEFKKMAE